MCEGKRESVPQPGSQYSNAPVPTVCVSARHIQAVPLSGGTAGDSLSTA